MIGLGNFFLFPASRSEEGELLNSPSSVRPSVHSHQITQKVFVRIWQVNHWTVSSQSASIVSLWKMWKFWNRFTEIFHVEICRNIWMSKIKVTWKITLFFTNFKSYSILNIVFYVRLTGKMLQSIFQMYVNQNVGLVVQTKRIRPDFFTDVSIFSALNPNNTQTA